MTLFPVDAILGYTLPTESFTDFVGTVEETSFWFTAGSVNLVRMDFMISKEFSI